MKYLLLALIPFALSFALGDSYQWQPLGGAQGSEPGFVLVESDLDHMVADVSFPGFWLTTFPGGGRSWDRIEMEGCTPQGEVGFPELPSFPVVFGLPFGTEAVVTIESVEYTTYGNMSILPRQPVEIDMYHAPWPFEMNDRVYGGSRIVTPGSWAATDMDAIWSGLHCARLVVNPFSYDASSGDLLVASRMRIRVDFAGNAEAPVHAITPSMESVMAGEVVNFGQFRNLAGTSGGIRNGAEYIVICTSENQAAVAPLYELHNWLGLKVQVEVLTAPSNPGAIFGAIADNYETGVTRFALIVGTHAELPSYSYGSCVGDYYYACLTGGDNLPEIGVGRLTGSVAQIEHQVDKIIGGYLEYSFEDGNTTGITPSETVLAAHQEEYPGKYTLCCNQIAEYPYSLTDITFTKVYPPEGGTAQMVADAVNNGIGTVGYRGHGDVTYWAWSPGWTSVNIDALTNSFMPPVFNIACYCGRYQDAGDCLSESWQFAVNGASGNLGANDPSYTDANHTYMKELYKAIYDTGVYAIGEAVNATTAVTIAQHGTYGVANAHMYCWFGDPAMEIWTFDTEGEPGQLDLSGPPQLEAGAQTIMLSVTAAGSPIEGASVTLTDGIQGTANEPSFYEEGVTDASGQVSFSVTIPSSGIIHAGAFMHDYQYDTLSWTVGVGIEEEDSGDVTELWMGLPSPNPVTTSASLSFSNPVSGRVDLAVFDVTGRLVESIISSELTAGEHTVEWQTGQIANGVYFVRLNTPSGSISRQVMVVR